MRRILLLGRGGSGKSTLARQLGQKLGIPAIELDKLFWCVDLSHPDKAEWAAMQREALAGECWIADGDLGPNDDIVARLPLADTIVLLDFPVWICVARALRRSRERLDFWLWLISWRRSDLPKLRAAISAHAPSAKLIELQNSAEVERFLSAS